MEVSTLVATMVLGTGFWLALLMHRRFTRFNGILERMGVPIDKTSHFKGHKIDFKAHDIECLKKFGPVWGRYKAGRPEIFVADVDLLKELLVKKFDDFSDRQHMNIMPERHISVIDGHGETWKSMRKALTPTFTSGKIKGMFSNVDMVVEKMLTHVSSKVSSSSDGEVDVRPVFQGLSLDSISNCAFGIQTDSFANPNNKLFKTCRDVFASFFVYKSAFDCVADILLTHVPLLSSFIDIYDSKKWDDLWETTKQIVETREADKKSSCGDFIDRLVEIKSSGLLNENQTYAQGIGFFQAGFETTSNTLSTLTHALSKNPMVQQRLYEEVQEVLEQFGGKVDHETVSQLNYAQAVIYENLRLNSPVIRFDRHCLKDCQVGHLLIPKDCIVNVPVWAIHHNPDLYPEPFTFDPERFLDSNGKFCSKNNDMSFLAFGGGPRTCIGMRFAMAEMLITLAKFVSTFKICEAKDAEIVGNKGDPFMYSYPEVRVKLEKR